MRTKNLLLAMVLVAAAAPAFADWYLDTGAKTLTNKRTGVVLVNIGVYSGSLTQNDAKLQINDNKATDVMGVLDLSESITSSAGNTCYIDTIHNSAFQGNTTLTGIVFPEKVVRVRQNSFYGCTALTGAVVLPDSVSDVGTDVFRNTGITSFTAGANTPGVGGANGFRDCAALETIDLSASTKLTSFSLNNDTSKSLKALTSVKLPASCTSIGAWTLADNASLLSIDAPGVVSIGDNAFKGASSLAAVSFPAVETVGASAFSNCQSLQTVELPSAVSIGASAFNEEKQGKCPSKIVLGKNLESVGANAFRYHNKSANPLDVWFWGAPEKGFDSTAFANCASGVHTIHILYSQSYKTVLEGDWNAIAASFGGTIPEVSGGDWESASATWTIGSCDVNVVYFVDPDEVVVEVEKPVFTGSLSGYGYTDASFSVTLSGFAPTASSVTLTLALYEGSSLAVSTNATYSASTSAAWTVSGLDPGHTYTALLSGVDNEGTAGDNVDLGSFTTLYDPGYWTYYPDARELRRGNVVTVRNVSANGTDLTIGSNSGDNDLSELDFSGGVEGGYSIVAVSGQAFRNCKSLVRVVLPESVKRIENNNAFNGCSSLVSFEAPGLEYIGSYAFDGDSALASFSAPALVEIAEYAFKACAALTSVGDLDDVETVGNGAFQNCRVLKDVLLPGVVSVGSNAFNESSEGRSPTNVVFGASLQTLGASAFAWHNKSDSPLHVYFYAPPAESGIPADVFDKSSSGVHFFHILWSRAKGAPAQQAEWEEIAKNLNANNALPQPASSRKWDEAATTWNVGGTTVNVVYFADADEPSPSTAILIY
ncbi:MAG: leucine-rich repeat protein [Kiritimatiellae bacterium]|nr:leucine-rich repeat protein [Kiritimatiellia bacterium]